MDNRKKHYVRITQSTSSDDIFALLDAVGSDEEEDIDNLMNDSDTEFFANEDESALLKEDDDVCDDETNILVPCANIYIVPSNKKDVDDNINNQQPTSSKSKSNETLKWKKSFKSHDKKKCSLEGTVKKIFPELVKPMEVYEQVLNLDILVELLVAESNLYAQQKGRKFLTNNEEIKAFLGINYFMGINHLPAISMYWDSDIFIGNTGIQNVSTRNRFQEILQNLHFTNNTSADTSDKGNKIRPIIDHLNDSFREIYSDEPDQSIDEHMTKFKGRSSMKQYIKSKPIKWGFKWWFRCASSNGYLYEFDLYLGRKKQMECNLGEGVILSLSEKLKGTYCTLYFDNFFNSPLLMSKLFERNIYAIGTVQANRKQMPKTKADKEMKRGDIDIQQSEDITCCKWFDNRGVVLLATNVEGMSGDSSVLRRMKGSATKTAVPCPNIVKLYNKGMGGVDLMDQKAAAYRLDRRSKVRFYLRLFFDLLDVALVNSHIVYQQLGNELSLLDFKIAVANGLIGRYNNRKRTFPTSRPNKRKALEPTVPKEVPMHLPIFQQFRKRCHYCKGEGKDNKTFTFCEVCGLHLCCIKERNCFYLHHLL